MRLLHVISSLGSGGAQRLLCDLAVEQRRTGTDVAVVVTRREESPLERELRRGGVPLYSLDLRNVRSPRVVTALRNFLRRGGYDAVHVHLFPSLYQVVMAAYGLPLDLFYTEHSTSNRRRRLSWLRPLERFIYRRYKGIFAVSEEAKASLARWLGHSLGTGIVTIPNGIDLSRFGSPAAAEGERAGVLMVARFTAAKDHLTLLRAIGLLRHREVTVSLAGTGETLPGVMEEAERLGVGGRVRFLGDRSDIPALMAGARVGVLATHYEGMPLSVVEMMASGLPVVASDVKGVRELATGCALLVREGDRAALATAIDALLDDDALRARCRREGLRRASAFSISRTARLLAPRYRP